MILILLLKVSVVMVIYDIEPKQSYIIQRDTLKNPPNYDGKFILTNPPYIARNKNENKEIYDIYKTNDLYKCFILSFINSNCKGGIIIIPINFLCSQRTIDINLRKQFLHKFHIRLINIFEEKVFDDTSTSVCVIQFDIKKDNELIKIDIYPSKKSIQIILDEKNNYTIGGEILEI